MLPSLRLVGRRLLLQRPQRSRGGGLAVGSPSFSPARQPSPYGPSGSSARAHRWSRFHLPSRDVASEPHPVESCDRPLPATKKADCRQGLTRRGMRRGHTKVVTAAEEMAISLPAGNMMATTFRWTTGPSIDFASQMK
ncbi:unnamed protein product [Urochloa humidicola]